MIVLLWMALGQALALPSYADPSRSAPPVVAEQPFVWETAFDPAERRLVLTLTVPVGHTVYRDQVEVTVISAAGVALAKPDLPAGERKPDPAGQGARELYSTDLVIFVPVKRGHGTVELELRHQGCKGGLCFAPVTERRFVEVRAPQEPSR
ncbi:MAG: protein-disulfide reductase DsbD N-terminal domain-containing protein [Proteobacteria bacterium]|nr:protein-disulfide reductase DsbD N-terminal domain-containing protein [Pseudomonadota bacterium]